MGVHLSINFQFILLIESISILIDIVSQLIGELCDYPNISTYFSQGKEYTITASSYTAISENVIICFLKNLYFLELICLSKALDII